MKCDHCEHEATIHELRVAPGTKIERHLCGGCAGRHGTAVQPVDPVTPEIVEKYMQAIQQRAAPSAKPPPPPHP